MSKWWNQEMGAAAQGLYNDPWLATNSTMVPSSLFPGDQQPAMGVPPTPTSLGMKQEDFDKYVTINKDGSWSITKNLDGSARAKGFMGFMGGLVSDAKTILGAADKAISSTPILGQYYDVNKWLAKKLVLQPLDIAASGAYWLYSEAVSQPLTTAILQIGKAGQGNAGALMSGSEWGEAYHAAEHISPGQALANVGGTQGMSPLETAARFATAIPSFGLSLIPGPNEGLNPEYQNESYLYDTNYWQKKNGWKYSVGTGFMDATASIALDPTIAIGAAAKPLRAATRAVKVAEGVQPGVKLAGIQVVKPRTAEDLVKTDKFGEFAKWGIGKSPAEIQLALERGRGARGSAFTSRDMSAQLADVLSKADNVDDWRLAARFSMGDAAAFTEMSQKSQSFALAFGKALDNRINLTNADGIYKKSYNSLVSNNFTAKPINPLRTGAPEERGLGPLQQEFEFTPYAKRSVDERVKVDEQGRMFLQAPYVAAAKAVEETAPEAVKPFEQLAFEGKGFTYEVKPIDPTLIPTNYYQGVNIPGLIEWRAGVESGLEATKVQINDLASKNDWLARAIGNVDDPAAVNPLFGSMREARFAGIGRNVVKQAERRQVQYLGVRADEGFQSRLLQNGIYGAAVRFIGKMGDRLPTGVINHNDGDAAARLGDYLKASPVAGADVGDLVRNYSRIADKSDSVKYIEDVVEPMIFEGFGKKYNLDLPLIQEMFARYRQISLEEMGKARAPKQMFAAPIEGGAGGKAIRVDKMKDGEKIVASPILQTQLQYSSALPNLKAFDRFLVKNAPTMGKMRKAGIGTYDVIDNVLDSFNTVFKLGNLLRISYVARNVGEETLSQAAKFGAFAVMANVGKGGMGILRNALPSGAILDEAGRAYRSVQMSRSLPMVQQMNEELADHVKYLQGEISRRMPATGTFAGKATQGDAEGVRFLQDRLDNARAAQAEFKSYEDELLQHGARQAKSIGEGTFMYRGQVIPEALNEAYAGAIPRDQITSSESWKTVFGRIESFGKEDMIRSGNHVSLTPKDPNHLNAWERAVNLQILQDPVGLRIVQDGTGESALKFLRSPAGALYRKNLGLAGGREPTEHIRLIKSMIDQYIPESMREQAAKNGKVAVDDFKAIPLEDRPLVHGEELKSAMKGNEGAFSWFDKINEKWFQGLPRMASDRLSWQPTYVRAHRMHMQELVDLHLNTQAKLGEAVEHINMETMNKLMSRADKMARQTMKEVLYQPNRTNTGHALRYISPFFSAYTDSMARWGGLILENPDLIGKTAKIYNAPIAADMVTDRYGDKVNEDGENSRGEFVGMNDRVFNFQINPLTKNLPPSIKDMKINVGSLNVVTPGQPWWSPGFGPVVAIPADTMMRNFPKSASFLNWINPYGTTAESTFGDVVKSITPGYIEDLYDAYDKDGQKYQDAMMASYRNQMVDYHQNGGKLPDWKKAEADAQNLFFLNALADGIMPGKTRESDKYQFYVDALKSLRQQDAGTANDQFMARYGKDFKEYADALMFTAATTKSGTGVPSTPERLAASEEYGAMIKEHPELGAFIVGDPQAGEKFSQWALLNQKASGDRTTVTAEDRIKKTAINAGWESYVKIAEAIRGDMVKRGLTSLQQKGGEDLAAMKQRAVYAIANKYPEWADDYTTTDRDAVPKRIQALREIVSDTRIANDPNRTDVKYMRAYLLQRQQFMQILARREAAGGSSQLTARSNVDLFRAWGAFREAIAEKDTKFSASMERYLSQDMLQGSVIKVSPPKTSSKLGGL